MDKKIHCGGFDFFCNFDSANLAKVDLVPTSETVITTAAANVGKGYIPEIPDVEFNLWTKHDCCGTQFENPNRTWFYFGMRANAPGILTKLNIVDLNKQLKIYSQGMAPVFRVLPGKPHWERIRDKPTYSNDEVFTLSFKYRTPENPQSVSYFAFTYPFSYTDIQNSLTITDSRFSLHHPISKDDIYYVRECLCNSLEARRIDLITISSYHNISIEREMRLKNLFPEHHKPRPFKFISKKIIFISARVHPGETPSSFVFNGFLNLLTSRDDPMAIMLRRNYVFKLIPCLNPDGVAKGHYRTDTRGVNLNRVYLKPNLELHPSIFAARSLLRYYHHGAELDDVYSDSESSGGVDSSPSNASSTFDVKAKKSPQEINRNKIGEGDIKPHPDYPLQDLNSGLYLYMDMHGHASKKGIFMYGNHFQDLDRNVECMLLPKLMALNNHNFHFTSCNFTERNMYLKDKRDGMSREGSGRVAVLKMTGLIRSYTLECNYNTGNFVNILPPTIRESNCKAAHVLPVPPKYNPVIFEEVGRALGGAILDLSGQNPMSRLPASEFHSLSGLREWLRTHSNEFREKKSPHNQGKGKNAVKSRSLSTKATPIQKRLLKNTIRSTSVPANRVKDKLGPKEFEDEHPSCSHAESDVSITCTTSKKGNKVITTARQNNAAFTRVRKEIQSKMNRPNEVKSKGIQAPLNRSKAPKPEQKLKLKSVQEPKSEDEGNRVQLKEICFIKDGEGKKVIAKYNKTDSSPLIEDNLIVAWNGANSQAQVFSQKSIMPKYLTGDPGTSRGPGIFRVHNFTKPNPFLKGPKRNKRNMRIISEERKMDKVARKRKKLKSKV
ncbi:cytosolic carboxypeptidase-like protein 5 [Onthophagus taurus]|uniref:cytosolic carboxypeptidase-like protein 5 n=1 Tax=Onthophagus taurus TaxID=166361 RepID=UPI000C20984D|nr:cytosolic carboxypeptidase-like protein 5 isoform X2 [Onthophagus taurus]